MPFNCSVDAIANSDTMGCHYHWIINAYDKALIYIYIYIYISLNHCASFISSISFKHSKVTFIMHMKIVRIFTMEG